jgi:hypothetical protein
MNVSRFRVSKLTFISARKSMSQPSDGRKPKAGKLPAMVPTAVVAEEMRLRMGSPGRPHFHRAFRPAWTAATVA